jgi:hypothetical protein
MATMVTGEQSLQLVLLPGPAWWRCLGITRVARSVRVAHERPGSRSCGGFPEGSADAVVAPEEDFDGGGEVEAFAGPESADGGGVDAGVVDVPEVAAVGVRRVGVEAVAVGVGDHEPGRSATVAVFEMDVPAEVVDDLVMMPAQKHEVVEVGGSLAAPVLDVVGLEPPVGGAAGESAPAVAGFESAALRR